MRLDDDIEHCFAAEYGSGAENVISESKDFDKVIKIWRDNGPSCFITRDPFDFKEIYDSLRLNGLKISFVNNDFFVSYLHEFMLTNWSVIFICIDDFGGVSEYFNELRVLRTEYPNVNVIIISKQFQSSDFSQERLAICDISLRLPYSQEELPDAVCSAFNNNNAWILRNDAICEEAARDANLLVKSRRKLKKITYS